MAVRHIVRRRWLIWAWVVVGAPLSLTLSGAAADFLTTRLPSHAIGLVIDIVTPGVLIGLAFVGLMELLPPRKPSRLTIAAIYGLVIYLAADILGGPVPYVTHARILMPY